MNPRKRKLMKLKALEAKKAAVAPVVKPAPKPAPKVVEAPKAEEPAVKPVRKRKPRKTATKKEE